MTDINPTSATLSGQHRHADIKMAYSTRLYQCKMKYLSDIGMVDLVSTTDFIVQITQLHKIDSSQTSAALSGQHRDADIKIISKWHIFVGFTDVEIYPTLNDVVSATKFHRIFVVSISAAISAWHIALLNSKRYGNGMFISDLPIQMSTIDGWYRVLNGIASYLYRLTAIVISVQHNVVSKLCFFVNHRFADVVSRYPSDIKWSTWCSRGTPSSILFRCRARYRPGIIPTSIDRHRHGDGPPIMISFHFRSVFD